MVNKKKSTLFIFGCVIIAIAAMLLVYGVLVATGVVHLKQNKLVFTAGNAEKFYDGLPLTDDSWELSSGKLQSGHRVVAVVSGEQTLPGKGVNNVQVSIFDENDIDVSDEYVIEYVPGTLFVKGVHLVFSSASAEKEYDGSPLVEPKSYLTSGKPMAGHKISHRAVGTITELGSTSNFIEVEIVDTETGNDVSYYYEIEYQLGTLSVTRIPIALVTKSGSKFYDGEPLVNTDYYIVGTLKSGHVANVDVLGSVTNPGISENRAVIRITDIATGEDVTSRYEITNDFGTLTVVERENDSSSGGGAGEGASGEGGTLGSQDINNNSLGELTSEYFEFTSNTTGTILMRMQHFGDYTMNGWMPAPENESLSDALLSGEIIFSSGLDKSNGRVRITNDGCSFLIPYYTSSKKLDTGAKEYSVDYVPYNYLKGKGGFTLTPGQSSALSKSKSYAYDNYTALPIETKAAMLSIFNREATKSGYDPAKMSQEEIIRFVVDYVKNAATYNLNFGEYPEGVDTAVYFLTEAKEGVCRHYATSAVAMLRANGIPARYTVGFKVSAIAGTTVVVMGDRAHAWVEVFTDELGWVAVDPTGSAPSENGGEGGGSGSGEGNGEGGFGSGGSGIGGALGGSNINSQLLGAAAMNKDVFKFTSTENGRILFKTSHFGDYAMNGWADTSDNAFSGMKYVSSALKYSNYAFMENVDIVPIINMGYLAPYYQLEYGALDADPNYPYSVRYYSYSLSSGVFEQGLEERAEEEEYRSEAYLHYLSLPESTYLGMREIIEHIEAESGVDFSMMSTPELVLFVEDYIKGSATYKMDFCEYPEDADTAIYFLTEAKEGVCRHFATAATAMYRALGIPARYTVGFAADAISKTEVTVKGRNAHAWVEVYIDGFGWVSVDPTGSSSSESEIGDTLYFSSYSAEKVYDGSPLTCDGFELLSELPKGFSAEVVMTGSRIDAGISDNEFTVKILDADGNDVTGKYKIVKDCGKLTVNKRELTVATGSAEKNYNGTPLTSSEYSLPDDVAVCDTVTVEVLGTVTDPGTVINKAKVTVKSSDGRDVTKNYAVIEAFGTLTVNPIGITVTSSSAERTYDGTPLTSPDYFIEGALLMDHRIKVDVFGSRTEPGIGKNSFNASIFDSTGTDVSDKYSVTKIEGELSVLPLEESFAPVLTVSTESAEKHYDGKPLTAPGYNVSGNLLEGHEVIVRVFGSITEPGRVENSFSASVVDEQGNNVTGSYRIEKLTGTLTVLPFNLTVTTASSVREYNGMPLTDENFSLEGHLAASHRINATFTASQTEVGTTENTVSVSVLDDTDADVTYLYEIDLVFGELTVTTRSLTIVTESAYKFYDGKPLYAPSYTYDSVELLVGDRVEVKVTGSRTEVGSSKNTAEATVIGSDGEISENYSIILEEGDLTVYKDELTITSKSASKSYDGSPLTESGYTYTDGALLDGHTLNVICMGMQSEIGVSENTFVFSIIDATGTEVTDMYIHSGVKINTVYGQLEIRQRELTVISDNEEKLYDGTPLVGDSFTERGLIDGEHHVEVEFLSSITEEGECDNVISVTVLDSNGKDVTELYNIEVIYGTLKVIRTHITVSSDSASKVYDGEPLVADNWRSEGTLRAGHRLHVEFDPFPILVGTYDNSFTVTVIDERGKDVTLSYNLTTVYGSLAITQRRVSVESFSSSKEYDGTPLTCPSYSVKGLANTDKEGVVINGSQTEIGASNNSFDFAIFNKDGEDVTDCYDVSMTEGILTVTEINLMLISDSAEKQYDTTPLTASGYQLFGNLLDGHGITVNNVGTVTEVGSVENVFEYLIFDAKGEDVEKYYSIEKSFGVLTVHRVEITLRSDNSAVYIGQIARNESVEIGGELIQGHTVDFYGFASRTSVGEEPNLFKYRISDDTGKVIATSEDPGGIYNVKIEYGTLTVLKNNEKLPLTIRSATNSKIYDGTELTDHNYDITRGNLTDGDTVRLSFYGSQTEVGASENLFDYEIYSVGGVLIQDGSTDPDLAKYEVAVEYGTLAVLDEDGTGGNGGNGGSGGSSGSGNINGKNPPASETLGVECLKVTADFTGSFLLREGHCGDYLYNGWGAAPAGESAYSLALTAQAFESANASMKYLTIELVNANYVIPYYTPLSEIGYEGRVYTVGSYFGDDGTTPCHTDEWADMELEYRDFVYNNYIGLPDDTREALYSLISEKIAPYGIDPSVDKLEFIGWVNSYVKQAAHYNLSYTPPADDVDTAVWFLTDPDAEGVCRHYATAATAVYRAMGIPARFVTGFSALSKAGETVSISAFRAHAWVEVYIDGIGWITVDPTGAADPNTPNDGQYAPKVESYPKVPEFDIENETADPIKVKINLNDKTVEYDGNVHYATDDMIGVPTDENGLPLILKDQLEIELVGEITYPGSVTVTIASVRAVRMTDGTDVSEKYIFDISDTAELVVKKRAISLASAGATAAIDELTGPLEYHKISTAQYDIDKALIPGHSLTCEFTGSQSTVGKSKNTFKAVILDENSVDVTYMYDIKYSYGTLTVAYERLIFETPSASKVYDGSPLSNSDYCQLISGYVRSEHTWDGSASLPSQTNPGSCYNLPTLKIYDEQGRDVSDLYIIDTSRLGRLTVERIKVTVVAESKSAVYDPKAPTTLVCESFYVEDESVLLDGHYVIATLAGELSTPGKCDSTVKTAKVMDSRGNDVSRYYEIITVEGTLEITVK